MRIFSTLSFIPTTSLVLGLFFWHNFLSAEKPTWIKRGFRAGQEWEAWGCRWKFTEAVVVEVADGKNPHIWIYPREGEDFFHTVRFLPQPVGAEDQASIAKEESIFRLGNALVRRVGFQQAGKIWVYSVAREDKKEFLEFFLSCGA